MKTHSSDADGLRDQNPGIAFAHANFENPTTLLGTSTSMPDVIASSDQTQTQVQSRSQVYVPSGPMPLCSVDEISRSEADHMPGPGAQPPLPGANDKESAPWRSTELARAQRHNRWAPPMRTRVEMAQELEAFLDQPLVHATEFYVIDKIDRLSRIIGSNVKVTHLMALASDPATLDRHRVGMALAAGVRYGVLEKDRSGSGLEGAYSVTPLGRRYLAQSKALRIGLWEINRRLAIEEICAVIQIEGSDALTEMLLVDPGRPPSETAIDVQGKSDTSSKKRAGKGSRATPDVHPMWAGLLAED